MKCCLEMSAAIDHHLATEFLFSRSSARGSWFVFICSVMESLGNSDLYREVLASRGRFFCHGCASAW
jgi:hypothetical protein